MRDSSEIVWMVHRSMVAAGLDVDAIYQRLGYDVRALPLAECRPDNKLQMAFWQMIESVSQNDDIGLALCHHVPLFRGAGLDYLLVVSATLEAGLALILRYSRLVSDALDIRLVEHEDTSQLVLTGATDHTARIRHTEILYVYQCLKMLRAATDGELVPLKVRLCCQAVSDQAEYEAVFGCPVEFDSDASEIHFPRSMLGWQSPHADPELLESHRAHLQRRMQVVAHHDRMDELYEYLLSQFQATGGPGGENEASYSLTEVAYAMGLSSRRLRFELSEAGTCYRDLLVRAKVAHAKQLLTDSGVRIGEVADSVGFAKRQAFVRTFRQATGVTPSEYRAQNR